MAVFGTSLDSNPWQGQAAARVSWIAECLAVRLDIAVLSLTLSCVLDSVQYNNVNVSYPPFFLVVKKKKNRVPLALS